uniref:Cyclin C-terminal domain-containing protein n=1 Tax=Kalanchoe fedtschenkoi TaxID=63787 RepID=A0A7N0VML6_KALFE
MGDDMLNHFASNSSNQSDQSLPTKIAKLEARMVGKGPTVPSPSLRSAPLNPAPASKLSLSEDLPASVSSSDSDDDDRKAARADIEMAKTAQNLAELALLEPEQLLYWPSTVAASLVILSCIPSNQYLPHICVMKAHLRSADDNINECVKRLSWLLTKNLSLECYMC